MTIHRFSQNLSRAGAGLVLVAVSAFCGSFTGVTEANVAIAGYNRIGSRPPLRTGLAGRHLGPARLAGDPIRAIPFN